MAAGARADQATIVEGLVLVVYALYRTVVPLQYVEGRRRDVVLLALEAGLAASFVAVSGRWDSPHVFALFTPIIASGFARGYSLAVTFAAVEGAIVAASLHLAEHAPLRPTFEWIAELVLIALVAGFGRRLTSEAAKREEQALTRMSRLSEANDLLFQLHRLAQTLPASLDLSETVSSTTARLRELFEPNVSVVLLYDDASDAWSVASAAGARVASVLETDELPGPLRRALVAEASLLVSDLGGDGGPGFSSQSQTGMYVALRARQRLVGMVAVERRDPTVYTQRDLGLLDGLAEPAAVALDNARWFGRLRRAGADEERTRIARDLHDRVGQSLAYLAFSLDRITAKAETEPVYEDLETLRDDVRGVVTEVRETLYDLRTDVSEEHGLVLTLGSFLDRVRSRTDVEVEFHARGDRRLPLPLEREMWRIAQEAVSNAERHARAKRITVSWACDDRRAELIVSDDGQGLASTTAGKVDSYGLVGIRERADAIGAALDISSEPSGGTSLRCWLYRTEEGNR